MLVPWSCGVPEKRQRKREAVESHADRTDQKLSIKYLLNFNKFSRHYIVIQNNILTSVSNFMILVFNINFDIKIQEVNIYLISKQ